MRVSLNIGGGGAGNIIRQLKQFSALSLSHVGPSYSSNRYGFLSRCLVNFGAEDMNERVRWPAAGVCGRAGLQAV